MQVLSMSCTVQIGSMSSYHLKTAPPNIILRTLLDPSRKRLEEEVLEILLWHQRLVYPASLYRKRKFKNNFDIVLHLNKSHLMRLRNLTCEQALLAFYILPVRTTFKD